MQKIYIALGSNIGDRLANLQQAVDRIDEEIGKVLQCASVYKVPAVGFSGADFLNTCLVAFSSETPDLILENLQAIERALGREQASDGMYHDRPIDFDLIMKSKKMLLKIRQPQLIRLNKMTKNQKRMLLNSIV